MEPLSGVWRTARHHRSLDPPPSASPSASGAASSPVVPRRFPEIATLANSRSRLHRLRDCRSARARSAGRRAMAGIRISAGACDRDNRNDTRIPGKNPPRGDRRKSSSQARTELPAETRRVNLSRRDPRAVAQKRDTHDAVPPFGGENNAAASRDCRVASR